ncbi:MAG: 2Fe-2S iron-sulfur cluster-binding protein, partial [Gammaproteobacteria bacterium]|nr:2Fe-2S iron-sulfur cluster-binding protein [Gammaproteobacteria bacterium]
RVPSTIGAEGRIGQAIELDSTLSYFASLSQSGIKLSSNCDGSGSCGLCKVRYDKDAPEPTEVDRDWISAADLTDGFRLGCQHNPRANDNLTVPEFAFLQTIHQAEVVSCKWLTPLLKEICIRPDPAIVFCPGDYLEFQIPNYEVSREQLGIPTPFSDVWAAFSVPEHWSYNSSGGLVRTYSIATAPNSEKPQELVFTVRFSPPPIGGSNPPGVGSSYLCGLQAGSQVSFRGPAGDFRLIDSDREKILIGGGAGMAPLKSMAIHLLQGQGWQGKLRFWYGARNQGEILYRETFEALAKNHTNFEWRVALSDAAGDISWEGEHGLIHESIFENVLKHHQSLSDCEFYLCGPPLMLAATRSMLKELGISESLVRFDDFGN